MPKAYVVGRVQINDPEAYEKYRAQVPATIAQYQGTYIVRGGKHETLEGPEQAGRMVVLEFPSYEQAKAWHASAEYEGPKALRQAASDGQLVVVEGME